MPSTLPKPPRSLQAARTRSVGLNMSGQPQRGKRSPSQPLPERAKPSGTEPTFRPHSIDLNPTALQMLHASRQPAGQHQSDWQTNVLAARAYNLEAAASSASPVKPQNESCDFSLAAWTSGSRASVQAAPPPQSTNSKCASVSKLQSQLGGVRPSLVKQPSAPSSQSLHQERQPQQAAPPARAQSEQPAAHTQRLPPGSATLYQQALLTRAKPAAQPQSLSPEPPGHHQTASGSVNTGSRHIGWETARLQSPPRLCQVSSNNAMNQMLMPRGVHRGVQTGVQGAGDNSQNQCSKSGLASSTSWLPAAVSRPHRVSEGAADMHHGSTVFRSSLYSLPEDDAGSQVHADTAQRAQEASDTARSTSSKTGSSLSPSSKRSSSLSSISTLAGPHNVSDSSRDAHGLVAVGSGGVHSPHGRIHSPHGQVHSPRGQEHSPLQQDHSPHGRTRQRHDAVYPCGALPAVMPSASSGKIQAQPGEDRAGLSSGRAESTALNSRPVLPQHGAGPAALVDKAVLSKALKGVFAKGDYLYHMDSSSSKVGIVCMLKPHLLQCALVSCMHKHTILQVLQSLCNWHLSCGTRAGQQTRLAF